MEQMHEWINHVLQHPVYGYFGLFSLLMTGIIALPVPDELILASAGVLTYDGTLRLAPTLLAAVLGSWCGITVSYALGRTAGLAAVNKMLHIVHGSPERAEQLHKWFERWGKWSLVIGYWLPGIRHFTAILAGVSALQKREFVLYAYSGGLVWCMSYILLGNLLGKQWEKLSVRIHETLLISSIIITVVGVLYFGITRSIRWWKLHHKHDHSSTPPPGAP